MHERGLQGLSRSGPAANVLFTYRMLTNTSVCRCVETQHNEAVKALFFRRKNDGHVMLVLPSECGYVLKGTDRPNASFRNLDSALLDMFEAEFELLTGKQKDHVPYCGCCRRSYYDRTMCRLHRQRLTQDHTQRPSEVSRNSVPRTVPRQTPGPPKRETIEGASFWRP